MTTYITTVAENFPTVIWLLLIVPHFMWLIVVWRLRRVRYQDRLLNKRISDSFQQMEVESGRKEEEIRQGNLKIEELGEENRLLNGQCQDLLQKVARLEVEKQSFTQIVEEQKRFLKDSSDQLEKSFRGLASQALDTNNQAFLSLAQQIFSKETQIHQSKLEERDQSLQLLLDPIRQTLRQYQNYTQELEVERKKSYVAIEGELKRMGEMNVALSQATNALKNALKKPHVRGRWGEIQLRNCIELAGMSEYSDVHFQDIRTLEDGQRLIPDLTVRMPGGRVVVVDAKTPIEAFITSLETTDSGERAAEMIRHGRLVKEHVKKLSLRAYGETLDESADFTIMFLPNESFLYAALEAEPDLVEFALKRKVLIATPPTLVGLLKVIRFGWNEEKLAANAQKISEVGKELHKRIADFTEAYLNVGKALDKARQEYDTGWMRLERRVLPQAQRLEKLGAKSHRHLPGGEGVEEVPSGAGEIPQMGS